MTLKEIIDRMMSDAEDDIDNNSFSIVVVGIDRMGAELIVNYNVHDDIDHQKLLALAAEKAKERIN